VDGVAAAVDVPGLEGNGEERFGGDRGDCVGRGESGGECAVVVWCVRGSTGVRLGTDVRGEAGGDVDMAARKRGDAGDSAVDVGSTYEGERGVVRGDERGDSKSRSVNKVLTSGNEVGDDGLGLLTRGIWRGDNGRVVAVVVKGGKLKGGLSGNGRGRFEVGEAGLSAPGAGGLD